MKEKEIVTRVESYLMEKGFKTFREVPALTKRIDIVGIGHEEVWTIEAKVRDWRHALRQANQNRIFGHRPYVALCHQYLGNIDEALFDRFGIGIMGIGRDVNIVKPAKKSEVVHTSLAETLLRYVGERDG